MVETVVKGGIIAASCYGAYLFIGSHVHKANEVAFGLDGMGVTYLLLAAGAVGLVTYKFVK